MWKISFFKNGVTQKTPSQTIDIKEVAEIIVGDDLVTITEKYRSITDKKRKEAFKKSLPLVTFSGLFKTRKADDLIEHSGFLCVDCDHVGDTTRINEIQELISDYYAPALSFISPSGDGLKVVFSININEASHLEYFQMLRKFFIEKIGVQIDEACKDVSRACFLVHDARAVYTDKPSVLDRDFIAKGMPSEPVEDSRPTFEQLVKWTNQQGLFIKGNRNKYITALSGACHRFGYPEAAVMNSLAEYASHDFTMQEIEAIVKSTYRNVQWYGIAQSTDELTTSKDNAFIRVGITYYKIIRKPDRWGIDRVELKTWNKDCIVQDYKKGFLKAIPRYNDFVMVPDNLNYTPVINKCYNLYSPFQHVPAPGEWLWTERLVRHIFGEQYDLGIRYLQILYLNPDRSTIILVLVSKERGTGKTTFLNWINMLFGSNVAVISSTDFLSGFNGHYATKNILAIEETLFDKKLTIEKLKALTTAKYIQINEKYAAQFKIPFYGKIILTSNNEDKFASIDQEEIRFLVRKIGRPEFTNHAIEDDLLKEIPAFLHFLQSLAPVDWSVSRSGFLADELKNDSLDAVVRESKSGLYKDLMIALAEFFNNSKTEFFYASVTDLKNKFFPYDNRISTSYLRKVLKDEFNMEPGRLQRYYPFEDELSASKTGRPYRFDKKDYCEEGIEGCPF